MDDNKYNVDVVDIRWTVKIHSFIVGFFARNDLLKEFCENNGIDYKPIKDKKYVLPSEYLFSHSELKYFGDVRDKLILAFYEDYKKKQIDIIQNIQKTESDISIQEEIINNDKEELNKFQTELKSAKDPQARITLQNSIEVAKTKIKNGKIQLNRYEQTIKDCNIVKAENLSNWKKQIDIIDNAFNIERANFDKNASKKIRKYLNYTKVHSKIADYSNSVKQIIDGGFDGKAY